MLVLEAAAATRYGNNILPHFQWSKSALCHAHEIDRILYPTLQTLHMKNRMHAVQKHPVFNFIHSYYQFSGMELKTYSPGLGIFLEDFENSISMSSSSSSFSSSISTSKQSTENILLHPMLQKLDGTNAWGIIPSLDCYPPRRYSMLAVKRAHDILEATVSRSPNFGCFGLHEWAMLYSNRGKSPIDKSDRHQPHLDLRVSQSTIDDVVESTAITCTCTHFDAWRFFSPAAQPLNIINPLTRSDQPRYEQPACIHATMDLFKYAYQLYPFVSSELIRECLIVAIDARKIDIRASPYDVSHIEGCERPLFIEQSEGKLEYFQEQTALYTRSFPIREKLLRLYKNYLSHIT